MYCSGDSVTPGLSPDASLFLIIDSCRHDGRLEAKAVTDRIAAAKFSKF